MLVLEGDLVQARRVALTFALELREASLRPITLQSLEEPAESALEIDESLLADMRRDLVQPWCFGLLQFDEPCLQLAVLRPLPCQLVGGLRLREAPVVDVPARADALPQLNTLRPIRVELKRVAVLA